MTYRFPASITRKTAGGWQWWTDHVYRDGYRIQQSALSSRWRLLTETNHRVAEGSRAECRRELDALSPLDRWDQVTDRFVVLSHGLLRSTACMAGMQSDLIRRGFKRVIRYGYASSRGSIEEHGEAMVGYVESLPVGASFDFVGHSMGNIVLRTAIGHWQRHGDPRGVLPRMHRVVMLGPPNQGAMIARQLARTGVFGWIAGPGAMQLGPHWDRIEPKLGIPPCPFAIIAGDRSGDLVKNPLVDGPCDYFVSLEEAKLEGAAMWKVVPVIHASLMNNAEVQNVTAEFLSS